MVDVVEKANLRGDVHVLFDVVAIARHPDGLCGRRRLTWQMAAGYCRMTTLLCMRVASAPEPANRQRRRCQYDDPEQ
jgi:hypothetical protein